MRKITNYKIQITKGVAPPTHYCIGSGKSHWEEKKSSHGLPKDSFKLQTMTALIKSFCGGSRGGGFSKRAPLVAEGKKIDR